MSFLYDLLIQHPSYLLAEIDFQTILLEEGKAEGFREHGKNFCAGMISHMPGLFAVYGLLFDQYSYMHNFW